MGKCHIGTGQRKEEGDRPVSSTIGKRDVSRHKTIGRKKISSLESRSAALLLPYLVLNLFGQWKEG